MRPSGFHPPPRRSRLLRLVPFGLLALLLLPYGGSLAASAHGARPASAPDTVGSVTGSLTWNGADTSTAPTAASPIAWSFSQVATAVFSWTGPVVGPGVSQAFLVVVFFGLPAYTKQQVESQALPSVAGSISMTYDLTQFKWYLQGLYQIHAYLEDPSGNSVWSETFFVKVTQSYDLVVATVGLLIITVLELYMIATVGPRAADKVRKGQAAAEEESAAEEPPGSPPTAPPGKT